MKRTVIYKVFSVVMLTLAVFNLTSCADKEQLPKEEPIFPEMQALKMIEPGEEIRLGITPNLDWEISIPEESSKWFKILEDGKFPVTSVKGKASKLRIYIKIWTTDEESFDLRSCKVFPPIVR